MHPQVSILLLNYNGKKFNQACINSILTQSYQHFEILFIDNASSDGSVEEVEQIFVKEIKSGIIRIIRNERNEGFANGNNIGHQLADEKSKYVCLLNNDTTVEKKRLEELVKVIEGDETLGAVGSLILDKGYEQEILTQIFEEKKKFMLSIFGETVINFISNIELEKGVLDVNGLSGCCIMYRRKVIDIPFADYYFAYAEDVFLSWRILKMGYNLGMCVKSIVYHYGSGSFGKKPSNLKLFHGNKNQIINFIVFFGIRSKILLFPLFLIKEIAHLFLINSLGRLKAKGKAWFWILQHKKNIQSTIKIVRMNSCLSDREFIAKLVWKLSDNVYFNPLPKIMIVGLTLMNKVFFIYGKIMTLFI